MLFSSSLKVYFQLFQPSFTLRAATMSIKTFVFLDCETTGLPSSENNKTKITELCLISVQSNHLSLGSLPRVQNKISLCFNPRKFIHPIASEVTGLYNDLLECQSEFKAETVDLIRQYLEFQEKPICFVAHNGNYFDYPILREHFSRLNNELSDEILCIDSLQAFRELNNLQKTLNTSDTVDSTYFILESEPQAITEQQNRNPVEKVPIEFQDGFDELLSSVLEEMENSCDVPKFSATEIQKQNETTPKKQTSSTKQRSSASRNSGDGRNIKAKKRLPHGVSFKLSEVYNRLTGKPAIDAHKAEYDVIMLLESAATVADDFIAWANKNARKFNDIPVMKPGIKLGL